MRLSIIGYNSPAYQQMVALRMEVLRKPLGLTFTPEQLAAESNDIFIAAFDDQEMVGCCVLSHYHEDTMQLRQMAVKEGRQTKGVGREILVFAEQVALEKGYGILMMHARNVAIGFYKKCGYETRGEEFIEVTVPHYHMEKALRGDTSN